MKFIKVQDMIFNIAHIAYIYHENERLCVKTDKQHTFQYKDSVTAKAEFDNIWQILNAKGE